MTTKTATLQQTITLLRTIEIYQLIFQFQLQNGERFFIAEWNKAMQHGKEN